MAPRRGQHKRNIRNICPKHAWVNSAGNEIPNKPAGACHDVLPSHPPRHCCQRRRDAGFDGDSRGLRTDHGRQGQFRRGLERLDRDPEGTCDRAYRYPVQIQHGLVGYAGSASFTVSGKVGDAGAVTVTVARGSQSATGTGRMSATDGSGTWTAASGECSGTWTAERRS